MTSAIAVLNTWTTPGIVAGNCDVWANIYGSSLTDDAGDVDNYEITVDAVLQESGSVFSADLTTRRGVLVEAEHVGLTATVVLNLKDGATLRATDTVINPTLWIGDWIDE